ncbi:hypothetical protein C1J01_18500 [Nonomuraea aridisoli]|uniref:Uncharacterized protein n=1 Tax=Nonomuraea aridisoli TaxID=2070368 RepID=A0A2W2E3V9_9ACTN|nr:hypothetical protein C1J01_18500 [Nonomuraea aridisoli]
MAGAHAELGSAPGELVHPDLRVGVGDPQGRRKQPSVRAAASTSAGEASGMAARWLWISAGSRPILASTQDATSKVIRLSRPVANRDGRDSSLV